MTREELIQHLEQNTQVLQNPYVKKAFEAIDRKDFVAGDYEPEAYEDYALPIGFEQTTSQPTVIAFMLELLDAREGNKVLDIGSGSGFTTALLSSIAGEKGKVTGLEIVPELVELGRKNLKKYNFKNAEIMEAGKSLGLKEKAPFDKILVNASAESFPEALLDQLDIPGRLVIPVGDSIMLVEKDVDGEITTREFPGFAFVPLIEK